MFRHTVYIHSSMLGETVMSIEHSLPFSRPNGQQRTISKHWLNVRFTRNWSRFHKSISPCDTMTMAQEAHENFRYFLTYFSRA